MDRNRTKHLASLLKGISEGSRFELKEHIKRKTLSGFHPWADLKPCEGAFLFKNPEGDSLWVLLIDWREQENFYVVLFPESKSKPIAEIHHLTEQDGESVLDWRYSPNKRDGRNAERKAYFVEVFLSEHVQIPVPTRIADVDDFIEELFELAHSRAKTDALDPDRPNPRSGFPEGKLSERMHLSRERNRELVRLAKLAAMDRDGCLKCACCGFDFHAAYGGVGKGFIEAHHTKPVSTLHEDGEETKLEDLALVCSNCHRMLHRRRPWLGIHELSKLLIAHREADV